VACKFILLVRYFTKIIDFLLKYFVMDNFSDSYFIMYSSIEFSF